MWNKDSFVDTFQARETVLVCEGKPFHSTDGEELHYFSSTQEETDSHVILYSKYGQEKGYKYICVKSSDTDVFFVLMNFASQMDRMTVLFDAGKDNKKPPIDINDLARRLKQPFCFALLSLHAFTCCDSTRNFNGKGNVKTV